jgi:hypothetical protein
VAHAGISPPSKKGVVHAGASPVMRARATVSL